MLCVLLLLVGLHLVGEHSARAGPLEVVAGPESIGGHEQAVQPEDPEVAEDGGEELGEPVQRLAALSLDAHGAHDHQHGGGDDLAHNIGAAHLAQHEEQGQVGEDGDLEEVVDEVGHAHGHDEGLVCPECSGGDEHDVVGEI
eukprot:TRINITY_DN30432_c0_g1_i2.p3 TRINITY_DN30432_c0_g1~~TRINITY_DN30432_c0_g1_i2.p3  ORF type:complete len:142 (+),score=23.28 TRINITY_DN30432_c0_g1_i2:668-1093(+)